MSVEIVYPSELYFESFYETLSSVAKERIYIEMTEAPPLEKVLGFVEEGLIKKYRKLDGRYFDCLVMAKFLSS